MMSELHKCVFTIKVKLNNFLILYKKEKKSLNYHFWSHFILGLNYYVINYI